MLLYLLRGDPTFNMVWPVQNQLWQAQGGKEVVGPWQEIDFTPDKVDEFVAVDCLTMNTGTDGLLINNYARNLLDPLLSDVGEFWPVRVLGQQYWWHNCLALVDALDQKNTDADWSSIGGSWGSFKWITTTRSLSFKQNRVKRAPVLFRIPEYPQGVLFAQTALRNAVRHYGLTGFRFDLVWSADIGGVLDPAGLGFGGVLAPISTHDLESKRQAARKLLADRRQD
jgi:hypothetical protein